VKCFVFLVSIALTTGIQAQERILSFNSQIQIGAKGELTVLETIDVQVEGRQIKRGILRDFPTDYRDRYGRKVTVPFEVLSVKRDGQAENYSLSRQKNGVSVRIGNANVMLPRGRHVYEIAYRSDFQVGFFEQHDELYWNVNGNGWTFAMDEISAEVGLPTPVPAGELKVEAYTGPFGARGRDYTATARDGGASFRTTRGLGAGEGLTIVFMFPKGVVAPPSVRSKFDRWLKDNLGEAVGAAGFLVLASLLYLCWTAVGRDPRAGPLFPRYEAPTGLGPAGVRYLDKMKCDDRCFASALLGLGQRGFMTIRETGGYYVLERTGKDVAWLPGEQAVSVLAPPPPGTRAIGKDYDAVVQAARAQLGEALKQHYGDSLFTRNTTVTGFGIFLAGGILFAMFALDAATASMIVAGLAMAAVLAVAARFMPAYTVEGRRLDDEIEGLRQYLSVAEGDDLARMKMPPRTKEEFARFLPYAVALEVEKTWAEAFAKVLGAAALAQAAASYYSSSSDSGSMFSSSSGFVDSIADMGRTISAASTPPASSSGSSGGSGGSSSSGGGGGSSGGGGGGGGGSGW
jgi:uncharacterized membrane protein YgcG